MPKKWKNLTLSLNSCASQMDLDKFKKMIGSIKIDKYGNISTTKQLKS